MPGQRPGRHVIFLAGRRASPTRVDLPLASHYDQGRSRWPGLLWLVVWSKGRRLPPRCSTDINMPAQQSGWRRSGLGLPPREGANAAPERVEGLEQLQTTCQCQPKLQGSQNTNTIACLLTYFLPHLLTYLLLPLGKVPYDGPVDNTFILQPASGPGKLSTIGRALECIHQRQAIRSNPQGDLAACPLHRHCYCLYHSCCLS